MLLLQADRKEDSCKAVTCCATGADHDVIGGQLFWSRQPKVAGLLVVDAPWPHIGLHLLIHAVANTHDTYIPWARGVGGGG